MRSKLNFKINWKHSIGEIFLIFIGISLAIWFENFMESKQERKTEIILLKELLKDEERNVSDLEFNLGMFIKAKNGCNYVLDQLKNKKPYNDSLGIHFGNIRYSLIFQISKSSYNTILSIGWQIITNDSIRTDIIFLYDFYYDALETLSVQLDMPYTQNHFIPMYNRMFNTGDKTPIDYESLINDIEVANIVRQARGYKVTVIQFIRRRIDQSKKLQILIEEEIDRLES
ncbi:hypothetical protein ES708_24903 [subsurface metagenome]